ncbi:MAG: type IX secretion system sortase PorU [Candidatus Zixiibacteriota bacterium]
MKVLLYKSFFIAFFFIAGTLSSRATDDIEVIASGDETFQFKFFCNSDLSNLVPVFLTDSSRVFQKYVKVGIPYGSTARLLAVESRSPEPFTFDENTRVTQAPLVSLSKPLTVRDRQMVTVIISPVQGSVTYREIEITIGFSKGEDRTDNQVRTDPHFDRIFQTILANYDRFRTWPSPARSTQALAVAAVDHPLYKADQWYKIYVNETGLYRITGSQLSAAGVSLTGLQADSIRIFNSGGLKLSLFNEEPRPEFEEIAIVVEDGGDGLFGNNDYILFYGESLNRWLFEAGSSISHTNNQVASENVYWLCTSGTFEMPPVRMAVENATPSGTETDITSSWRWVRVEQDIFLAPDDDGHLRDYYRWYWSKDTLVTFSVSTPAAIPGDSAYVYIKARTSGSLSVIDYVNLKINGVTGLDKNCTRFECVYSTEALVDGLNSVELQLTPIRPEPSRLSPYLDYLDISYSAYLEPSNGKLDMIFGDLSGQYRIIINDNFSSAPLLIDLTDPRQPFRLTGYQRSAGMLYFSAVFEAGSHNRFYCADPTLALSPEAVTAETAFANLRETDRQVDLFIVTPRVFANRLDEYVQYREDDGYAVEIVTVEDIMDNFSYGVYDPVAIRDFLKFAYENSPDPKPSSVLFVGDANFDFLDKLETGVPNYVPLMLHEYSQVDYTYNDDNYVYFGEYGVLDEDTSFIFHPDRGYEMMTARWPVSSVSQINVIIDKIMNYESPANFGFWRNNVTLVADDAYEGTTNTYQYFHAGDTDTLAREHIPRHFNIEKIYLWDYPLVNREKPEVNDKIVESINDGTLIVNYVGHGNANVWAHEHVFQRQSDLPRLTNLEMLPLVVAASCEIGFIDNPKSEGMGEDFLTWTNGGAIGVLAATRLVYASDNKDFNQMVYDVLLYNDSLSICQSIYTAKLLRQYNIDSTISKLENDRAFIYLGGPFVRLGRPLLDIEFSERPDSLAALARVRVAGRVVDENLQTLNRNGVLEVNVYDSEREVLYRDEGADIMTYLVQGPLIYRGSASITAGEFNFEFINPLDINYGGQGAKIVAYALLDGIDGIGLVDSIPISDSIVISSDSVGPVISFNFTGRENFLSGDVITPGETLEITLVDSSGINLVGGLGHGITLEIDHKPENIINLSGSFEYDQDDFTTGSLTCKLDDLGLGEHHFKIKAWDNANNSSSVEFSARVVAQGVLAINNLLNYPNPMSENTTFYFELTQQVEKFSLEIFTLSGKKIKYFNQYGLGADNYPNGNCEITWDGKDAEGDRVATGVYIYKAKAVPLSGEAVESFGKVVVIN